MNELIERAAIKMATWEFSKNPSKVLRDVIEHPVMVTKYGYPIACIVSVERWNSMEERVREYEMREQIER